jgi:kynureninase
VDFLLGGAHKWLCGGPGASFLYVRPDLIPALRPRVTGWFAHKRPFAFDLEMDFADDAFRFATGTPNVPGVHAARAGIEIVAAVGVERIRARSIRLTSRLVELAEAEGLRVTSPRDAARRTGLVCIDFEGADRAEAELGRRGFLVDYRPRCGLRISPHFYTREEELFSIIPEINRLRGRR